MVFRPHAAASLIAAVLGLLFAHPAKADLVFQFSFSVTGGDVGSGTVTGEIFGLADNATSAATDIVITGMPGGAPGYVPSTPLDVFATLAFADFNSFTVADGVITSGAFSGHFGGGATLQLEPGTGENGFPGALSFQDPGNFDNAWHVVDGDIAVTYSLVPAPEPASIAIVGIALLGLVAVRRRPPPNAAAAMV